MSGSIKLKHASGNGVIIAAPSSNPASDRTLTLPGDADGVIAKTDASGNLAVTGDLTVDTDTLKVDSSNNRVGIGTTSPQNPLTVAGNGDTAIDIVADVDNNGANNWPIINFRRNSVSGTPAARIYQKENDNALVIDNNGSERMRIDGSGNVGIGTSSPSHKLHTTIGAGESNGVAFLNANSQGLNIYTDTSADNADVYLDQGLATAAIYFAQAGTKRMTIDSSGNIILTSNTTSKGNIDNGSSSGAYFNSAGQLNTSRSTTSNSVHVSFNNPNNTVGTITTSGTSTGFNTSSDYRLKENASAISDGITRLKTLKPYRFNFKADPFTTVDGFFAHEVIAVPEAVTGTKDEVDSNNNPVYQGIDQSKLVPLLTAALQEEVAKREALEARVAALEAK